MIDLLAAQQHFTRTDPILAAVMTNVRTKDPAFDAPQPQPPALYFQRLARSIIGQQLSVKAAATIWSRFVVLCGPEPLQPEAVVAQSVDSLRQVGLSNQKARYILRIADAVLSGSVRLDHLPDLSDEAIIVELTKLYGVGRWSAEMYLMFTLARPDVFSFGDLGLKMACIELYGHPPTDEIVQRWQPHRTAAALTLWRYKDTLPR